MDWSIAFFIKSISLGIALAMDAFSVSLANGLHEPCMKKTKQAGIAGIFAFFQFAMPMIGWIAVSTAASYFEGFQKWIPWIALALLGFIGGKMLIEGITCKEEECCCHKLTLMLLITQGIATSIDALSAGFEIVEWGWNASGALVCGLLIAVVTFALCFVGVSLGRKFGTKLSGKASVLGGAILIAIGLEIFISNFI